jgi:hypothetical protein
MMDKNRGSFKPAHLVIHAKQWFILAEPGEIITLR